MYVCILINPYIPYKNSCFICLRIVFIKKDILGLFVKLVDCIVLIANCISLFWCMISNVLQFMTLMASSANLNIVRLISIFDKLYSFIAFAG